MIGEDLLNLPRDLHTALVEEQQVVADVTEISEQVRATGTLHTTTGVPCALNLRSYHPILIVAGFDELEIPISWWNDRTLRFTFPPR